MNIEYIYLFFISSIVMFLFIKINYPIAIKYKLIDVSCGHKKHKGKVPLIGGISLYLNILFLSFICNQLNFERLILLLEIGILAAVGIIDDKNGVSVKVRMFFELITAIIMIFVTKTQIINLGDLLFIGDINLSFFPAIIFTVVSVIGTINCINMIDGLNGLASLLVICSFIGCFILIDGSEKILPVISICCGSLFSFLLFNLQVKDKFRCVFLGDCGSMILGFIICWVFITATQKYESNIVFFRPVTALFLLGIPLLDMIATILKRLAYRKNPLKSDRSHIHHIIVDSGIMKSNVLLILILLQVLFVATGILMHKFNIASYLQFCCYTVIFICYYIDSINEFKFIKKIITYFILPTKSYILQLNDNSMIKSKYHIFMTNNFSKQAVKKPSIKKTNIKPINFYTKEQKSKENEVDY